MVPGSDAGWYRHDFVGCLVLLILPQELIVFHEDLMLSLSSLNVVSVHVHHMLVIPLIGVVVPAVFCLWLVRLSVQILGRISLACQHRLRVLLYKLWWL